MLTRVLVVEDEALVALDIAGQLTAANFSVVGPAVSVAGALKLITGTGCDVALLDINLGRETSERVALELRERKIPFAVLTGYGAKDRPACFDGAPIVSKPAQAADIVGAVLKCLRNR